MMADAGNTDAGNTDVGNTDVGNTDVGNTEPEREHEHETHREIEREVERVADRLRVIGPRLSATAQESVRNVLQLLADQVADAEQRRRRPVPVLASHGLGDQVLVLGHDLLAFAAPAAPGVAEPAAPRIDTPALEAALLALRRLRHAL